MENNEANSDINQVARASTTHIIYHDDPRSHGTAKFLKLHPGFPDLLLPPNSIICSSSKGVLLFHDASIDNYCLFNPATTENSIKPLPTDPPRPHHPNSCTAILAMNESSFDVVFLIPLNDESISYYEVDVFSSETESWYSLEADVRSNWIIESHSYVSCNRNVFFLVVDDAMVRISVLKLDIVRRKFTSIGMPYFNTNLTTRTQLGRVGETICAVIVDRVVEIYLLKNHQSGMEENERGRWLALYTVDVTLESICEENIRGRSIICQEMPRPLRFESFRVELPLWVDGKIVMVDGETAQADDGPLLYDLRMIDHASVLPSCVALGLPHVMPDTILHGQVLLLMALIFQHAILNLLLMVLNFS